MLHHGAPSPKRTIIYSNMPTIARLDHGVLDKATRESKTESTLVRKYHDKSGKPRFAGTAALSKSQPLDIMWGWEKHVAGKPGFVRSYPAEFGRNLLRAYEEHLQDCPGGRRDLRFKPQFNRQLSEQEQFDLMPLGDVWDEAGIFEVVEYIWTSKKLRPIPT